MPPSSATAKPKNWPLPLPYLTAPNYSPQITPAHLVALRTKPANALEIPEAASKGGPSQIVKITPIDSLTHPANGQAGLFAAKDLKPGTFILEYLGQIHVSSSSSSPPVPPLPSSTTPTPSSALPTDPHANSDYDLSLDRFHSLAIDAAAMGNEARFVNDYRGVGERPNAEFLETWNPTRGRTGERGMGVWVLPAGKNAKKAKGIRKGEEILVSYGRGFWGARRAIDEVEEVEGIVSEELGRDFN